VSPAYAETLRRAHEGKIHLVLRNPEDQTRPRWPRCRLAMLARGAGGRARTRRPPSPFA
jgi:hypothetical protein